MASLPIFTPSTITQTVDNSEGRLVGECPCSPFPDPIFPDVVKNPQSELAIRNRGNRQNNRWQKYLHALWVHLSA